VQAEDDHLDQCSVMEKSPSATSAFQALTVRPWKVASMPAALGSWAAAESKRLR